MVKRRHKVRKAGESESGADRKYRMSELVEVAGVSRDMIKYYLRAKLLPKPRKPRPNLSLYTERHRKLIQLILRFQQQTKLSLPEIAEVFIEAEHDPYAIELELLSDTFQASDYRDNIIPFDSDTSSQSTSLEFPPEYLSELIEQGLLPDNDSLDENEEKIAGLLWAAREQGMPTEFFIKAKVLLQELAELEVKTLMTVPQPEKDYDAAVERVINIDRLVNRWIVSEKTEQARTLYERVIGNSEKALDSIHDTIYVPSKVFKQRYKIDENIASLERDLQLDHANLDKLNHICGACLLLTETEKAIAFADIALEVAPEDHVSIAIKSLSYGMDMNLEKALMYAKRLEASEITHPVALEARLLSLLMQAAKLGGVSDTTYLLGDAAKLFFELSNIKPENTVEQLEAWLLNGRGNTMFPDAINMRQGAIEDMETMLAFLEGKTHEELELPMHALLKVYQIYASYYLGLMYELEGKLEKAREHFEDVLQIDPSSNFGEAAYLRLG